MSTRGISTDRRPDWRMLAACTAAPDSMFPDPSDDRGIAQARSFCAVCPVKSQCLDAAMAEEGGQSKESRYGIRAGLTPGQRYYLRTRNRMPRPDSTEPVEKRASTRPLAPCGTPAAYERHVRNHEPVDDPCRLAYNAERREARARRKATSVTGQHITGAPTEAA